MKAMTKRRVVGLLAALVLALEVALWVSQPSGALPLGLANRFLGPNMLRAEIVVKVGGSYHDYLLDNGRIRNLNAGTSLVTLVEIGVLVAALRLRDREAQRSLADSRGRYSGSSGCRRWS